MNQRQNEGKSTMKLENLNLFSDELSLSSKRRFFNFLF